MLKFLIILLGIYLFFRLFARPIINFVLRVVFNKAFDNLSKQQEFTDQHKKPEGEVTVQKVKDKNQSGDYVDYEEVK